MSRGGNGGRMTRHAQKRMSKIASQGKGVTDRVADKAVRNDPYQLRKATKKKED